jgi:uncharacterized protein YkwD
MNANQRSSSSAEFFVAGGTLPASAPSYVSRPADEQLFEAAAASRFCYVLTTRQMGKSSLMVRTARRLKQQGVSTAIIDLTTMGGKTEETWYLDFLTELSDQLGVEQDVEAWWQERDTLGAVRRFSNFLRDVVLEEISDQIVIFVDEIDFTLGLPFADDFFAAVRATYNARALDARFSRLTFIFLGVAAPADLIKDRTRTPFNIGEGIVLRDLNRTDAAVLQQGLETAYPGQGQAILDRVFFWTSGHPYLTQKLCHEVVEVKRAELWTEAEVDRVVNDLFLSDQTNREQNLQFVQDRVLKNPHRRELLKLYSKVRAGKAVANDEQSGLQNQLKLAGLIIADNGNLRVHNQIYRVVFDAKWIKDNTLIDYNRIIAYAAIVATLAVISLVIYVFIHDSNVVTDAEQLQLEFNQVDTPAERLDRLARLFELQGILSTSGYDDTARRLFFEMKQREDQLALFQVKDNRVVEVIEGLYMAAADTDNTGTNDSLLQAMVDALQNQTDEKATTLHDEIQNWLSARQLAQEGPTRYDQALANYDKAIQANDNNPATHYEKARILLELSTPVYDRAAADLDKVIVAAKSSSGEVNEVVTSTLLQPTPTISAPPDMPWAMGGTPTPGSDRFEPNDNFDSATTIGLNVKYDKLNFVPSVSGDDPNTWDYDYFKVRIKSDMLITCRTLELSPGTDTTLVLYDRAGSKIDQSDDVNRLVGDLSSSLTYQTTYGGWLYVSVSEGFHRPVVDAASTQYSVECTVDWAPTPTVSTSSLTSATPKPLAVSPTPTPQLTSTNQALPILTPTVTATPAPFKSEFVNFIQIVDAVRKLIGGSSGLVAFLGSAPDPDYPNLRGQKLVPTPTPTPGKGTIIPTSAVSPTSTPFAGAPNSDQFEPNNDFASATTLGLNVKISNLNFVQYFPSDDPSTWDNDYFKVRIKPEMLITCRTLELSPGADTTLILYDNNQSKIDESDDVDHTAGDFSSAVTYRATYDGWLYALVSEGFHRPVAEEATARYSFECSIVNQSTPTPSPVGASDTVNEIFRRTNELRASNKLSAYILNTDLNQVALAHSQEMANRDQLTHVGVDGSTAAQRITNAGYGAGQPAENIYGGQKATVDDVWAFWTTDPPHLANLLNEVNTDIGIGVVEGKTNTYYTIVFGKPAPSVAITPQILPTNIPVPTPQASSASLTIGNDPVNLLDHAPFATWTNGSGQANLWLDSYPTAKDNVSSGFAVYVPKGFTLETGDVVQGDRQVVQTHPEFKANGEIRGTFTLELPPQGADLFATLAFLSGASSSQIADGVSVEVYWCDAQRGTAPCALLDQANASDNGSATNLTADLTKFAGQTGELQLVVNARANSGNDWLTWTALMITPRAATK